LTSVCHPEEAESHAKRATPDEGPMHFSQASSAQSSMVEHCFQRRETTTPTKQPLSFRTGPKAQ
jgi:hypothetical protein